MSWPIQRLRSQLRPSAVDRSWPGVDRIGHAVDVVTLVGPDHRAVLVRRTTDPQPDAWIADIVQRPPPICAGIARHCEATIR